MFKKIFIFQLIIILFSISTAFAQMYTLDREYEPVILWMDSFTEAWGQDVNEFFVYTYDSAADTWQQIPFQLDEVDSSGSYFGEDDGLVDSNDEIVFMAFDLGDQADSTNWIDNVESKANPRYEINAVDSSDSTKQGWAYIYQSPTLTYEAEGDYADYDAENDVINADNFFMGFVDGIMSDMGITEAGGGTGVDVLDRNKQRMTMEVLFQEMNFNEEDFEFQYAEAIDGPVRVIRYQYSEMEIFGEPVPMESEFSVYQSYFTSGEVDIEIEPDPNSDFLYMRISFDFNADISGSEMYFFNDPENPVIIDGVPDDIDETITEIPFWIMGSGDEGSVLQIIQYTTGIAETEEIYYYDNSDGGTGDGTEDTGDGMSYGDVGIALSNLAEEGDYFLRTDSYLLPANSDISIVDTLLYQFNNPLVYEIDAQDYEASYIADGSLNPAPNQIQLYENYPNPFNPNTTISFELPTKSDVELTIYNSAGQLVKTLISDEVVSGMHQAIWDGKNVSGESVSSGIYLYRLEVVNENAKHTEVKRCVLLK